MKKSRIQVWKIKRLKRQAGLLTGLFLCLGTLNAWELASITAGAAGGPGLQYEDQLQSVSGLGAKIQADWHLGHGWFLILSSDHLKFNLKDDRAHLNWNWNYWIKIYGYTVYTLQQDPVYEVNFTPYQDIKVKPITLGLKKAFRIQRRIHPSLAFEIGGAHFERRMWLEENWKKHFPSIDYTFEYDFRNYANSRSGWTGLVNIAAGLETNISRYFGLAGGVEWNRYILNRDDSRHFPMESSLQAFLELQILYWKK